MRGGMPNPNYETLRDAIARHSGAVLSLPSGGTVRHHKTRFLAEAENGFWIESATEAERPVVEALMSEESPVGVAFRSEQGSVAFAAPIRARQEGFRINGGTVAEALFLPFPDSFRELQRRQGYRVSVPVESNVTLHMWRLSDHAILRDRPMASQKVSARLTNISVMGAGAVCGPGRDGGAPTLLVNERMRVSLNWGGDELLTEGRVIHCRLLDNHPDHHSANNQVAMGMQFKKLEKDIEGRQALSKLTELVAVLQRAELLRRRVVARD